MTTTKTTKPTAQKESPQEAMQRVLSDAKFHGTHRATLEARREAAVSAMASSEAPDAAAEKLAGLEIQKQFADATLAATEDRIRQRGPAVAAYLQTLADELGALHGQALELIRSHVTETIQSTIGRAGWFTGAELLPLVTRSRPMREQHQFETANPAVIGLATTFYTDPDTGNALPTLHEEAVERPSQIISHHNRLALSIEAAKRRLDDLKREFARSRK